MRGRDRCLADRSPAAGSCAYRPQMLQFCVIAATLPRARRFRSKDRRRIRRRSMPHHATRALGALPLAAAPNVAPARGRRPDARSEDPQALRRPPLQCGNEGQEVTARPIITTKETRMSFPRFLSACAALAVAALLCVPAVAADACANRGELDAMYCDANKDMVADVPDGHQEVEEPVDDRVHLHARRGSGGLREHLQAVHRRTSRSASTRRSCSTRCRTTPPRSRRCARAGCTSAAFRPARPRSPSTSRAPCRSRSRATRRNSRATT